MRSKEYRVTGLGRLAVWSLVLALPSCSGAVGAGKKAPVPASVERNQGPPGSPAIMRLGQGVYSGPIGPWQGEARLIDLAVYIEAAGADAVRARDARVLLNGSVKTHHLAIRAVDPATGEPLREGRGTVAVTGPAGEREEAALLPMEGHFGANLFLDRLGRYTFRAEIAAGGRTGSVAFSHEIPEKPAP
jgi:hypothetical protein